MKDSPPPLHTQTGPVHLGPADQQFDRTCWLMAWWHHEVCHLVAYQIVMRCLGPVFEYQEPQLRREYAIREHRPYVDSVGLVS